MKLIKRFGGGPEIIIPIVGKESNDPRFCDGFPDIKPMTLIVKYVHGTSSSTKGVLFNSKATTEQLFTYIAKLCKIQPPESLDIQYGFDLSEQCQQLPKNDRTLASYNISLGGFFYLLIKTTRPGMNEIDAKIPEEAIEEEKGYNKHNKPKVSPATNSQSNIFNNPLGAQGLDNMSEEEMLRLAMELSLEGSNAVVPPLTNTIESLPIISKGKSSMR